MRRALKEIPMPPLVAFGVVVAGLYLARRLVKRELARVGRILERAAAPPPKSKGDIDLERDPATGVYRLGGSNPDA
jgi:hypothetical protein